MSHQPERTEKDCLNCGTIVAGKFCQQCGQENVPSHMNFFALVRHFIYDIFHFDGKFFDTLRFLFFRPGKVASEYVSGRRMKYLDPVRMYLFTSAFFFLLFFTFFNKGDFTTRDTSKYLNRSQRLDIAMELSARSPMVKKDSLELDRLALLLDSTQRVWLLPSDSAQKGEPVVFFEKGGHVLRGEKDVSGFTNISSKNSWLNKTIAQKIEDFKVKYRDNPNEGFSDAINSFLHRLPYLLFLSLPFFAMILKLLYVRTKRFFYFDHAIFTLYHYIFSFIQLLVVTGISALDDKLHWGLLGVLVGVLIVSWPVHLLFAMKRFYAQGWGRTFVKFFLLNLLGIFVLAILFLVFIFFSILLL